MASSDLVKRLRSVIALGHDEHEQQACMAHEAADRIEALERQCRASETPLVSGEAEGPARFWQQKCSAYAALREVDLARIEALETELNSAEKAIVARVGEISPPSLERNEDRLHGFEIGKAYALDAIRSRSEKQ